MANIALTLLAQRDVSVDDMARLVLQLQLPYNPGLTLEVCRASVLAVLRKREVQHAVIVGVTLDVMAERHELLEPLGSIVRENGPLFGMDKVLGLAIVNVYGSIGLSNYGYLLRERPAVLKRLRGKGNTVQTFLDDLTAAIVAAACARLAHEDKDNAPGHEVSAPSTTTREAGR
ncbi:MAG: phosphatidylglycerophosphatase A [Firmicutes bacterium]|nr:phosphatidylglycerophosphatase A [Bacillota bacterium]